MYSLIIVWTLFIPGQAEHHDVTELTFESALDCTHAMSKELFDITYLNTEVLPTQVPGAHAVVRKAECQITGTGA